MSHQLIKCRNDVPITYRTYRNLPKKRCRLPSKPTARSSGTMSAEKNKFPFSTLRFENNECTQYPQALPGSDASGSEEAVEDRMKLASFDELWYFCIRQITCNSVILRFQYCLYLPNSIEISIEGYRIYLWIFIELDDGKISTGNPLSIWW